MTHAGMNRAIRYLAGAALACLALRAGAQQVMEVITLQHATVQQVLPSLRPLLEPGGTLTGQRGQLIIRASPENIADLRLALEVLDRPARRLQISVRFDDGADASRRGVQAGGTIGNRGSNVDIRAQDAQTASAERVDQRLQVVEGGRAFITVGQSRPVPQRQRIQTPGGVVTQETFVVQDATTGFEVSPRLAGERVFLDIASQREGFSGAGVEGTRVGSAASGRLGEWFELGSIASGGVQGARGLASSDNARAAGLTRVWVKVEEIRN
jgi:type II secretory pathway component GspD/PulD (secretin)